MTMRIATALCATTLAVGISTGVWAQQTLKGQITKVDEPAGIISLKQDQSGTVGGGAGGATTDYRVKDGLLFNAVKAGDKVEVTVDTVDGKPTITKLQKQ
jgi:Cu/Ag efflux protein CusF